MTPYITEGGPSLPLQQQIETNHNMQMRQVPQQSQQSQQSHYPQVSHVYQPNNEFDVAYQKHIEPLLKQNQSSQNELQDTYDKKLNSYKFIMDQETHYILYNTPEIHRNFLINYAIKLAAESDLYLNYITLDIAANQNNEPNTNNQGKNKQPKTKTEVVQPEPSTAPKAAAGFSSW